MSRYAAFIFLLLIPIALRAEPPEQIRKKYVEQMYAAFELQSQGKSTQAFYTFADAYRYAREHGENVSKLATFDSLFQWYRKYGYNCGVMSESSQCIDEYRSPSGYQKKIEFGSNLDYKQEKIMRDFLFGVGQMISGVFCIAVNPPIAGRFGVSLVIAGGKYLFDSVNAMVQDSQEKKARLHELKQFEERAAASVK